MEQEELFEFLREDETIVPFVGAGLAIPAGVPSVASLARQLAEAADVADDALDRVAAASEAKIGLEETRRHVARIVGARKPLADSKLIKLGQWPAGRILTTNYDEAIEEAIRETGREALSIGYKDTEALTPHPGAVSVIHLHGYVGKPETIILPGKTTEALGEEEEFLTQVRAMMQPGPVLYLGFSFASTEPHLRGILRWLRRIEHPRAHLLVLPEDGLAKRREDLDELLAVPEVQITSYDADATHSFVGKVAAVHAFRPDATGKDARRLDGGALPFYVRPALVREDSDDGSEDLQGKVWGAEGGWSDPFVDPFELAAHRRAIVLATPGMGKTEMLHYLARYTPDCESLVLSSPDLVSRLAGEKKNEEEQIAAVAAMIAAGVAGQDGTPIPEFDSLERSAYLFLLDDFDQGHAEGRGAAVSALLAACERWPQHRWLIAGRPCEEMGALGAAGFERYRIYPSELWGRRYLEARGIDQERIDWLIREQTGFSGLIGIPLFAAETANRLLDDEELPESPLELIVDTQRKATRREASSHGHPTVDLQLWLGRLAVGLELRDRIEARVDELASVPGRGSLTGEQIRERMVRASLLVQTPDKAAFPRRTLQEALCADAILATEDPVASIERVAVAEIAGECFFRSDMDFTVDLVFESAQPEVRAALRPLDEARWALTVGVRGSEQEGGEALDLLLAEANRRGRWFSRYAHGLRPSAQAIGAIVRRWPALVEERRAALLDALASEKPQLRFNALWVLVAQPTDPDPSWLPAMVEDPDDETRLAAARAAARWRMKEAVPALEAAVRIGSVHVRKRILQALLELSPEPKDALRVVGPLLNDGPLFEHAHAEIDRSLDLDGYLQLLAKQSNNFRIWEWLIDRLLETARAEDWTDERVSALVMAVVHRDGDPEVARDVRLREVISAHPRVALAAANTALAQRPPAFRGLAMFNELDAEEIDAPEYAEIRAGAERAVADSELERWRRPQQLDWQALALRRLEEPEADTGAVLDPQLRWPLEQMDARQRLRLRELAEAHLPGVEDDLNAEPFGHDEDEILALGALNAAAQLDLGLERDRWMQLFRSPNALESASYLFDWLARRYSSDYDAEIEAYLATAEDGNVLSKAIASLPRGATGPRAAIARRLGQFETDVPGWANAVGILSEPDDAEVLQGLRGRGRTEHQEAALRLRLARMGQVQAQREELEELIASAPQSERREESSWWKDPIVDNTLLELLAELLIALGGDHSGTKLWDFVVGKLTTSPSPAALEALDRAATELTPGALDLSREALARRLAAAAVLARLPTEIAAAAMVLEPDGKGGSEGGLRPIRWWQRLRTLPAVLSKRGGRKRA